MAKADLHVHTSVSDCSECAQTVLKQAKKVGITHIAFTNHDTTEDSGQSIELAKSYGIQAVTGVEMSAIDPKKGVKAHILGYGYKKCTSIEEIGKRTLQMRNENCLKQMEILEGLGYTIDEEEIKRLAGSCIYKQHILDYLCRTNQTDSMFGEVYQTIFKNGGPCDFDIAYPDVRMVVRAIIEDGGYPVLAHPGQQQNYYIIPDLLKEGLKGIERNHPSNSMTDRAHIDALSKGYGLFQTGGSDYHGRYERTAGMLGAEGLHVVSTLPFF